MENLDPPPLPPQIKDGKMARFCPSRGFILDLGGMGVCCSILFCPRLQLWYRLRVTGSQRHIPTHKFLKHPSGSGCLQFEFQNLTFRTLRKKPCRYFTIVFALSLLLSQFQFVFVSFSVFPFLLSHVAVSRPCRMSEFNSNRAWMVEMTLAA